MQNKTLTIMDACELAEKISAIQNTENEISFAACFDVDKNGAVIESSTEDWWGVKFMGAFDGTFLLFGAFGGANWHVYDAYSNLTVEELQFITNEIFRYASSEKVCVEESKWV